MLQIANFDPQAHFLSRKNSGQDKEKEKKKEQETKEAKETKKKIEGKGSKEKCSIC